MQQNIPFCILIILLLNLPLASPTDCTVTATVTFNQCAIYCWQTYQGKKDFYNFNTGNCQQRITCGKGYYNDWENNICIDEFGGYVLQEIGWVVQVKEKHVMFAQLQLMKGYFVGNKLVCDDGWKSSMKTQKKNDITLLIYLCDQEIKDGEIYPKTHGEYFFEKLTLPQQVYALDSVFGVDSLSSFFTLKMKILTAFTCLYWLLNLLACCTSARKKANSKLFNKKSSQKKQKLTQSELREVKEYLEKRKEEKMKAFGEMKQFSLHGEIKGQFELMKKIKQESAQILRKKWEKKLQRKEKQKNKIKQISKENSPISKFEMPSQKKIEQKRPTLEEKQKPQIIQKPSIQSNKNTQKWKKSIR